MLCQMLRFRAPSVFFISLLVSLVFSPVSSPASPIAGVKQTKLDKAQIKRGKILYEVNCAACHGLKGDGLGRAAVAIAGVKPRDFTAGAFKYGSSSDELFNTITKGVEGTAMPAWGQLPETDRRAVVAYLLKFVKSGDRR